MSKWFVIKDFNDFVDHVRALVFKFFGSVNEEEKDSMSDILSGLTSIEVKEMNETLTHEESARIIQSYVKKVVDKKTKRITYKLTDEILYSILEELNSRLVSNILNKLVNDGVLESAFDSEKNDFIFWVKENDKDNKQTPETD